MTWATAAPQSTMIHSPFSSPSMRGLSKPASRTASRTLAAKALVCRLEVPLAMITRSNKGERCSVLNTTMSWPLTSSKPSTMARWSFWTSFLAVVSLVMRASDRGDVVKYSLPRPDAVGCWMDPWRQSDPGRLRPAVRWNSKARPAWTGGYRAVRRSPQAVLGAWPPPPLTCPGCASSPSRS